MIGRPFVAASFHCTVTEESPLTTVLITAPGTEFGIAADGERPMVDPTAFVAVTEMS
jgi:hypothetical protein